LLQTTCKCTWSEIKILQHRTFHDGSPWHRTVTDGRDITPFLQALQDAVERLRLVACYLVQAIHLQSPSAELRDNRMDRVDKELGKGVTPLGHGYGQRVLVVPLCFMRQQGTHWVHVVRVAASCCCNQRLQSWSTWFQHRKCFKSGTIGLSFNACVMASSLSVTITNFWHVTNSGAMFLMWRKKSVCVSAVFHSCRR